MRLALVDGCIDFFPCSVASIQACSSPRIQMCFSAFHSVSEGHIPLLSFQTPRGLCLELVEASFETFEHVYLNMNHV